MLVRGFSGDPKEKASKQLLNSKALPGPTAAGPATEGCRNTESPPENQGHLTESVKQHCLQQRWNITHRASCTGPDPAGPGSHWEPTGRGWTLPGALQGMDLGCGDGRHFLSLASKVQADPSSKEEAFAHQAGLKCSPGRSFNKAAAQLRAWRWLPQFLRLRV